MTPDGAGAVSQLWIPKGERSGLLTLHGYGKRFIVCGDEKLTAFLELELLVPGFSEFSRQIFLPIVDHEMPPLLGLPVKTGISHSDLEQM